MAWVASRLGGVLQAALSINGIINGRMVALFTHGYLFPWINSYASFHFRVCIFTINEFFKALGPVCYVDLHAPFGYTLEAQIIHLSIRKNSISQLAVVATMVG